MRPEPSGLAAGESRGTTQLSETVQAPEHGPEATPPIAAATALAERFLDNVETVVHGKREEITLVLTALACEGHVLLEDVPGTAKTVLARAIARSIDGATQARIQCTPDLQPTDVTGLGVFDQREREFEFRPGPIFANLVLVDEINRAMPKTQSSLLEAMAERQVTVEGETRLLPDPFLLLATENPIEHEGTFPLPEAQVDRFFLKASLGYPGAENELRIIRDQRDGHPLGRLGPVLTLDDVRALQAAVRQVYIDPLLQAWVVRIVETTRSLDSVSIGASVRGSLALERAARAAALLAGRDFVVPADIERLVIPVLGHRITFAPSYLAEARRTGPRAALEAFAGRCLEEAPAPRLDVRREDGAG
jgi:MoxR-like ATPase